MQTSKLPQLKCGVSPIIHAYLTGNPVLDELHNGIPTKENVQQLAQARQFSEDKRTIIVDTLREQYKRLAVHSSVERNLVALGMASSRTITTGHQLCLSMGPFYMISKVCSAIALANQMNDLDETLVYLPVFWMATEDHDFDEINHLHLFNKKIEWEKNELGAVGRMSTKGIPEAIAQISEIIGADFALSEMKALLDESYREPDLASATRRLFNALFGEFGLLIVDGDSHALKSLFKPVLRRELAGKFSESAIRQTSEKLKNSGFKTQINPREINLFFLEDGYRDRIVHADDRYSTVDGVHAWSDEQIMALVEKSPESFSPNVALRPVFQEEILPNVAYIGGAGEIAYWLQLKGVFDAIDLAFPALVVRESTLILNKGISKKIDALGLNVEQLFQPSQEVVRTLLSDELPDWEGLENGIHAAWRKVENALDLIDPTLSKSAASEKAKSSGTLKSLQAKALRASKEKNEAQVRKVEAIHNWVYPEDVLQERYVNILQFGADQVLPLIKFLINEFEPGEASMHVVSFD